MASTVYLILANDAFTIRGAVDGSGGAITHTIKAGSLYTLEVLPSNGSARCDFDETDGVLGKLVLKRKDRFEPAAGVTTPLALRVINNTWSKTGSTTTTKFTFGTRIASDLIDADMALAAETDYDVDIVWTLPSTGDQIYQTTGHTLKVLSPVYVASEVSPTITMDRGRVVCVDDAYQALRLAGYTAFATLQEAFDHTLGMSPAVDADHPVLIRLGIGSFGNLIYEQGGLNGYSFIGHDHRLSTLGDITVDCVGDAFSAFFRDVRVAGELALTNVQNVVLDADRLSIEDITITGQNGAAGINGGDISLEMKGKAYVTGTFSARAGNGGDNGGGAGGDAGSVTNFDVSPEWVHAGLGVIDTTAAAFGVGTPDGSPPVDSPKEYTALLAFSDMGGLEDDVLTLVSGAGWKPAAP